MSDETTSRGIAELRAEVLNALECGDDTVEVSTATLETVLNNLLAETERLTVENANLRALLHEFVPGIDDSAIRATGVGR